MALSLQILNVYKLSKMNTPIEEFKKYAEDRLKNHIAELSTKYNNEEAGTKEQIEEAYRVHKGIFGIEMAEKITALVEKENPWLNGELENIKENFESKLDFKNA